jgi:hypothetical protein
MGESFNMSKMDLQKRSKSSPMHAVTSKVPTRPLREAVLETTQLPTARPQPLFQGQAPYLVQVQQPHLHSDSPQPLVLKALVQRQHLASNKGHRPLEHLLLVPLPSVRLLPLVNLPSSSLLSATRPQIPEDFPPLRDQAHQPSQAP